MQLQDYINDVQELLHDATASSWSIARVTSRINTARSDAARDMHCVRNNIVGIQLLPGVEMYSLQGAIAGAVIVSGGSNFGNVSTVPVTFAAAPAGGITATGIGNIIGGSLNSITMTQWGVGYTSQPAITIGGLGSGASALSIPLFNANPLSSLIGNPLAINGISFTWNGRRTSLGYKNFTLFQAYARAWATNFNGPPSLFTHVLQQNAIIGGTLGTPSIAQAPVGPGQLSFTSTPQTGGLVYIQTPPDQLYLSEWDITFMPSPLVNLTDVDTEL